MDEDNIDLLLRHLDAGGWTGAPRPLGMGLEPEPDKYGFLSTIDVNAVARPGTYVITRQPQGLQVQRSRPCKPGDFGIPRLRKHALEISLSGFGMRAKRVVQYNADTIEIGKVPHMTVHQIDGERREDLEHSNSEIANSVGMAYSIPFTERYDWMVRMEALTGSGIRLLTTPHAALVMFKDRDRPATGRRKALIHWVRAHQRVRGETAREVRAHLRGNELFNWHGYAVRVMPSPFDRDLSAGQIAP